jgi:hypothetical protein
MKRGQVSVFVIVGIVIIGLVLFFFLFRSELEVDNVSGEVRPLYDFVQECVDSTAQDGLEFIGESGGYFDSPELSNIVGVAYHYHGRESYLPEKGDIANELEKYMNTMLFFCTRNFVDFPDYEVEQSKVRSEVEILGEKVVVKVIYPLSIKKGDDGYSLRNFESEVGVRLGVIYEVMEELMEEQLDERENICISCIGRLAEEKELLIDMHAKGNDEVTFFVIDQKSIVNEEPYIFRFVNSYDEI